VRLIGPVVVQDRFLSARLGAHPFGAGFHSCEERPACHTGVDCLRRPRLCTVKRLSSCVTGIIRDDETQRMSHTQRRAREGGLETRPYIPGECVYGYSLVEARDRSFQSPPCFCQFIRMCRLVFVFLPSATAWLSPTQRKRTIAASPTTRICGS
jgi:hypothetical protein